MRGGGTGEGQDDSLTDSHFNESDYDCEGGDGDLFAHNVVMRPFSSMFSYYYL